MNQVDLSLKWPDPNGTANVDLTLRPAGKPVRLQGEVGRFKSFLLGEVASIGMSLTAEASKARFDGLADLTGAFDGRITGASEDTRALMAALGMEPVEIPRGLGRKVLFAADTTYTPDGRISLRDLSLSLDENALRGGADLNLGGLANSGYGCAERGRIGFQRSRCPWYDCGRGKRRVGGVF